MRIRIGLNPYLVFVARPLLMLFALLSWDWARGGISRQDFTWPVYAIVPLAMALLGISELRARLRASETIIIDGPKILRSRRFWNALAMLAATMALLAWIGRDSEKLTTRFLVGSLLWIVGITLSSAGRPKGKGSSPYIQWPRFRLRKRA